MEEKSSFFVFDKVKNITKSFCISLALNLFGIFILSIFLCYTNTSEKIIEPFVIFITSFSVIIGSFVFGKKIKKKGLIYGGMFGIIYIISLFILSGVLSKDFSLEYKSIIMIVCGVISGIFGGILGVNVKI